MNSTGLYDLFRSDTGDDKAPYLWTETDVWGYIGTTHNDFVRLTGGIADFTSEATEVPIVTGEPSAELSKKILRVMGASRRSDGGEIEIINATDVGRMSVSDYGRLKPLLMDNSRGPVRCLVLGKQKHIARWINVPEVDDTADLHIYRLPLKTVDGPDQEFEGVDEEHIFHLLTGVKALAYRKQDANVLDVNQAEANEARFRAYCERVKSEWERYKHKTRVVAYGGI